jgi:hypothetical protein
MVLVSVAKSNGTPIVSRSGLHFGYDFVEESKARNSQHLKGIGWHVSITIYRAKIYQILRQIYDLMPLVRPDNQLNTQNYEHHYAFARLERMLSSTQVADSEELGNDSILRRMVNEYMDIELASLDKSLKLIKYNLDSEAVVRLACGKNRIERWIFVRYSPRSKLPRNSNVHSRSFTSSFGDIFKSSSSLKSIGCIV